VTGSCLLLMQHGPSSWRRKTRLFTWFLCIITHDFAIAVQWKESKAVQSSNAVAVPLWLNSRRKCCLIARVTKSAHDDVGNNNNRRSNRETSSHVHFLNAMSVPSFSSWRRKTVVAKSSVLHNLLAMVSAIVCHHWRLKRRQWKVVHLGNATRLRSSRVGGERLVGLVTVFCTICSGWCLQSFSTTGARNGSGRRNAIIRIYILLLFLSHFVSSRLESGNRMEMVDSCFWQMFL